MFNKLWKILSPPEMILKYKYGITVSMLYPLIHSFKVADWGSRAYFVTYTLKSNKWCANTKILQKPEISGKYYLLKQTVRPLQYEKALRNLRVTNE